MEPVAEHHMDTIGTHGCHATMHNAQIISFFKSYGKHDIMHINNQMYLLLSRWHKKR